MPATSSSNNAHRILGRWRGGSMYSQWFHNRAVSRQAVLPALPNVSLGEQPIVVRRPLRTTALVRVEVRESGDSLVFQCSQQRRKIGVVCGTWRCHSGRGGVFRKIHSGSPFKQLAIAALSGGKQ